MTFRRLAGGRLGGVLVAALSMPVAAQEAPVTVFAADDRLDRPEEGDIFRLAPPPGLAERGVRVGSFVVRPTVALGARGVSDLLAPDYRGAADVAGVIAPEVTIDGDRPGLDLQAYLRGNLVGFAGHKRENLAEGSGGVSLARIFSPALTVRASAEAGRFIEDRAAAFTPADVRKPVRFERMLGSLGATYTAGRLVVSPTLNVTRYAYHDARRASDPTQILVQRNRSFVRLNPSLTIGYVPVAGTVFYAAADYDRRDYDLKPDGQILRFDRDSKGYAVYGGVRFQPTPLTRLDIAAGYQRQRYKAPLNGPSGLYARVTAEWSPSRASSVRLTALRDISETGAFQLGGARRTRVEARYDREIRRDLRASLRAEYRLSEVQDVQFKTRQMLGGAALTYYHTPALELFGTVDLLRSRGTAAGTNGRERLKRAMLQLGLRLGM
ncbi:outer membrane beta-barrel protein [Sphingomonas jatrophae]|uniref:Beta-barrel porin 2 n=1 Tax=Sphingomonas jatrophae TaxID=1166337 RepID=A0A1I6MBT7_9SPHN|nr:outer membrane beta-barrel protein [Sphingomonas jatrophae]SFS13121.1 hypothetical protein SAMN05192580_3856 [Sphingomonas jatrophae]